jgi:hypothetical protein
VELLVVIAIIGVLVALLLPAIQAAREAARRTQCNNNLKNIGLALQNYHDTYKVFPMGATPARVGVTGGPVLGPSWWYGILPFIEQRNIYDKIAATQRSGVTATIFTEGIHEDQRRSWCEHPQPVGAGSHAVSVQSDSSDGNADRARSACRVTSGSLAGVTSLVARHRRTTPVAPQTVHRILIGST